MAEASKRGPKLAPSTAPKPLQRQEHRTPACPATPAEVRSPMTLDAPRIVDAMARLRADSRRSPASPSRRRIILGVCGTIDSRPTCRAAVGVIAEEATRPTQRAPCRPAAMFRQAVMTVSWAKIRSLGSAICGSVHDCTHAEDSRLASRRTRSGQTAQSVVQMSRVAQNCPFHASTSAGRGNRWGGRDLARSQILINTYFLIT